MIGVKSGKGSAQYNRIPLDGHGIARLRQQEEITLAEIPPSATHPALGDRENRDTSRIRSHSGAFLQNQPLHPEILAFREHVASGHVEGWLMIVEVDARKRLFHVKLAWLSIKTRTIPVEDPISRIGVLLDLMDQKSRTDRVKPAGGDENRIARPRVQLVDELRNASV